MKLILQVIIYLLHIYFLSKVMFPAFIAHLLSRSVSHPFNINILTNVTLKSACPLRHEETIQYHILFNRTSRNVYVDNLYVKQRNCRWRSDRYIMTEDEDTYTL